MSCYERRSPKFQEGRGSSIVHIVGGAYFRNWSGALHVPVYMHPSPVGGEVVVHGALKGISCIGA